MILLWPPINPILPLKFLKNHLLYVNAYIKTGVHAWDKSGSTTLLDRNNDFAGRFFDNGIGAYGGLGAGIDVSDNISIDLAYDIIGLSKNVGFADASSLISVGIKIRN